MTADNTSAKHYAKLRRLLSTLFQIEQADLDFGIYRIMAMRRKEILKFLDNDLKPQIEQAFQDYAGADRGALEKKLDDAIKQAQDLGVDPETTGKVTDIRSQLETETVDTQGIEAEVFNHLYTFFSRYYDEGDFISQRRYREGIYAIPYEGEEVKLYWANHDQYYIKTAEYLNHYAFRTGDGRLVSFELVSGSTEHDNRKAESGQERRFILDADSPVEANGDDLVVRFNYEPDPEKRKQPDLTAEARDTLLARKDLKDWLPQLTAKAPTEKNPERTVLEKHLNEWTARNTFDYFIHKDLGPFLERELDFYIKNQVLRLEDLEGTSTEKVRQMASKTKVLRKIGAKLIDFLAQLEDFQKSLWLKRKLVVQTRYLVAVGSIPDDMLEEVASNEAQREEWVETCCIDNLKAKKGAPTYSVPLTKEFLKAHPSLMIDTLHFEDGFVRQLIGSIENLDDATDGVLVHSENFQALRLLEGRFQDCFDVVYVDPPYNTDASAILYKNGYKSSSWLALIRDRLALAAGLSKAEGVLAFAIDDEQISEARLALPTLWPNQLGVAVVRSNPQSRKTRGKFSPVHEYCLFYGKTMGARPGLLQPSEKKLKRYPKQDDTGHFAWMNLIRTGNNDLRRDRPKLFFPIAVLPDDSLYVPELRWDASVGQFGEYEVVGDIPPKAKIVYPIVEDDDGNQIEKNWHRGPDKIRSLAGDYRVRRLEGGKISIDFKTRLDESAAPTTWWDNKEYASANYGAKEMKALFGTNPFDYPKARRLVMDAISAASTDESAKVLDPFAGSGTTADAVISLNRTDGGRRKFVLMEMGTHARSIVTPRILKTTFTPHWETGRPAGQATPQEVERGPRLVKILTLESYEDALNNLQLQRTPQQSKLIEENQTLREDYVLRYMLDVESRGSKLDLDSFANPDDYAVKVVQDGDTRSVKADLVETFNWLLGIRVDRDQALDGVRVITGKSPDGESVMVAWRNVEELDGDDLDAWFSTHGFNSKTQDFDLVYINGDNTIMNLRKSGQTWQVHLIEDEFRRLMFDVQDV